MSRCSCLCSPTKQFIFLLSTYFHHDADQINGDLIVVGVNVTPGFYSCTQIITKGYWGPYLGDVIIIWSLWQWADTFHLCKPDSKPVNLSSIKSLDHFPRQQDLASRRKFLSDFNPAWITSSSVLCPVTTDQSKINGDHVQGSNLLSYSNMQHML